MSRELVINDDNLVDILYGDLFNINSERIVIWCTGYVHDTDVRLSLYNLETTCGIKAKYELRFKRTDVGIDSYIYITFDKIYKCDNCSLFSHLPEPMMFHITSEIKDATESFIFSLPKYMGTIDIEFFIKKGNPITLGPHKAKVQSIYEEHPGAIIDLRGHIAYSWQSSLMDELDTSPSSKIVWYCNMVRDKQPGKKSFIESMCTFNNCLHLYDFIYEEPTTMLSWIRDTLNDGWKFKAIMTAGCFFNDEDILPALEYSKSNSTSHVIVISDFLPSGITLDLLETKYDLRYIMREGDDMIRSDLNNQCYVCHKKLVCDCGMRLTTTRSKCYNRPSYPVSQWIDIGLKNLIVHLCSCKCVAISRR